MYLIITGMCIIWFWLVLICLINHMCFTLTTLNITLMIGNQIVLQKRSSSTHLGDFNRSLYLPSKKIPTLCEETSWIRYKTWTYQYRWLFWHHFDNGKHLYNWELTQTEKESLYSMVYRGPTQYMQNVVIADFHGTND